MTPPSRSQDPAAMGNGSLAEALDRLAAEDRALLAEAAADRQPGDLELARRAMPRSQSLFSHWPAMAAGLLAVIGLYLVLGPGQDPQPTPSGVLGGVHWAAPIELVPDRAEPLPVELGPLDRLRIAVFTRQSETLGVLVPYELPILEGNSWTPSTKDLAELPLEGFLELIVERTSGVQDAPLYVPYSRR